VDKLFLYSLEKRILFKNPVKVRTKIKFSNVKIFLKLLASIEETMEGTKLSLHKAIPSEAY
jgi:hypothetical protein